VRERDIVELRSLWANWPEADQCRWEAAITSGKTALSPSGSLGHLRPQSIFVYAYSASLGRRWALEFDDTDDLPHAQLWSAPRIKRYAAALAEAGYKSGTMRIRLTAVERVMFAVAPQVDQGAIQAELCALPRSHSADAKVARLQDRDDLYDTGVRLMRDAQMRACVCWADAVAYRTGLQIALLSKLPYRLQMFTMIEWLDAEPAESFKRPFLIKQLGRWLIGCNDQSNTRKAVPARLHVPPDIKPWLENYLFGGIRQTLCTISGYRDRRLWVSTRGPLGANGLYKSIVGATGDAFDKPVNPHLFRDCYATSNGRTLRQGAAATHAVLGNSPDVASRVYTHDLGTLAAGLEMARLRTQFLSSAPDVVRAKQR
jgi:integrase/recombinase XerD